MRVKGFMGAFFIEPPAPPPARAEGKGEKVEMVDEEKFQFPDLKF